MQQKRHAERLIARILGHEQARHEFVLERIGELIGQLGDVRLGHRRELLAHDLLRRLDRGTVHRRRGVGHFADAEHARCEACQAVACKRPSEASTMRPIIAS